MGRVRFPAPGISLGARPRWWLLGSLLLSINLHGCGGELPVDCSFEPLEGKARQSHDDFFKNYKFSQNWMSRDKKMQMPVECCNGFRAYQTLFKPLEPNSGDEKSAFKDRVNVETEWKSAGTRAKNTTDENAQAAVKVIEAEEEQKKKSGANPDEAAPSDPSKMETPGTNLPVEDNLPAANSAVKAEVDEDHKIKVTKALQDSFCTMQCHEKVITGEDLKGDFKKLCMDKKSMEKEAAQDAFLENGAASLLWSGSFVQEGGTTGSRGTSSGVPEGPHGSALEVKRVHFGARGSVSHVSTRPSHGSSSVYDASSHPGAEDVNPRRASGRGLQGAAQREAFLASARRVAP